MPDRSPRVDKRRDFRLGSVVNDSELVQRMLAKTPADRPTMAQVEAALRRLREQPVLANFLALPLPLPPAPPDSHSESSTYLLDHDHRRLQRRIGIVIGLGVGLLVFIPFALSPSKGVVSDSALRLRSGQSVFGCFRQDGCSKCDCFPAAPTYAFIVAEAGWVGRQGP